MGSAEDLTSKTEVDSDRKTPDVSLWPTQKHTRPSTPPCARMHAAWACAHTHTYSYTRAHCIKTKLEVYFMWMCVLSACRYVYHMHAWYLPNPEGVGSPGARVTDGCEPLCGC